MFICNFSRRKIRKNGIERSIAAILAKKWKQRRSFSSSSIPKKMSRRRRRSKPKNKLLFTMNSITKQGKNLFRSSSTKEKFLQKSRSLLPALKEEIKWVSIARTGSKREARMMPSTVQQPALSTTQEPWNSQKTTPNLTGRSCKEQKLKMIISRKDTTQLTTSKETNKLLLPHLEINSLVWPIDKTPKRISTEVEHSTPSKRKT